MTKIYWIRTMGVGLGKVLCLSSEINFTLHWKGCYLAAIDKKSLSLKRKPCVSPLFYQKPCLFNSKTLKRKCSWQSLQMEFQTIQAISKGNIFSMENYQYWMLTIAKVKRLSKPSCVGLVAPSTNSNTEEPPCHSGWPLTHAHFPQCHKLSPFLLPVSTCPSVSPISVPCFHLRTHASPWCGPPFWRLYQSSLLLPSSSLWTDLQPRLKN